jgi:putative transposase
MVTPTVKREAVAHLKGVHEMSERRACRLIGCDRMTVRYRSRRPDDPRLRERLLALARERRRFGYRRLLIFLRREGFGVNHKRLFRIYREERLMVRKRGGRKRALGTRTPMPGATLPNDRWSLDFVSDQLVSGRRFRILAIYDDCTRECLAAVADVSLSGRRVARELDLLIAMRAKPRSIVSDNGTDKQHDPVLDRRSRHRVAFHRSRQAGAERLRRKLQWPPARRVPERDAVHVADAGAPGARRMAARLQHRAAAFSHRLAHPGRARCSTLTATGPRRCATRRLRALAGCSDCAGRPDSNSSWMKLGGNVS